MAEKTIDIASPILSRNERLADQLRQRFNEAGTYVINVLSMPRFGQDHHDPGHQRAPGVTRPAALCRHRGRYRLGCRRHHHEGSRHARPSRSTRAACATLRAI